jgi:hypothetical protein
LASSLTINSVVLGCKDFRENVVAIAAEWDDWENSAYKKEFKYYSSLKRWNFLCVESGIAWASSDYKAMRDALEAGVAVNCTFVFDGETIVNENVYIIGVTKRYRPSYDLNRIREYEVEVREVF